MEFLNDFVLSTSLSGGLVRNLKAEAGRPAINDMFYLHNFKGITNLGNHYVDNLKKTGLGSDILGFDKYVSASFKISQDESYFVPKMSFFEASPFVFANAALAPNRSLAHGAPFFVLDYLRASAGLGCTFLSKTVSNAVAIECYLNLWVHKQTNEL